MARPATPGESFLKWTLRAARRADASTLATIDAAASAYPWPESQFVSACSSVLAPQSTSYPESVQLLEADGEICGFVVYSQVMDDGCIHNIAVSPPWQGQRKASILLQGVFDILLSRGAHRCLLEVRESNTAGRGLYEYFNFQLDGVRKKYYPVAKGREDALLMSKLL